MSKIIQNPVIKSIIAFLKAIKLPGFHGFSIYDLFEMYFKGIIEGALSYRAGSIAFSFFYGLISFFVVYS